MHTKYPDTRHAHLAEMNMEHSVCASETKREYNIRLFRVIAPRYDFITIALSLGRDRAWKRHLMKMLPAREAPSCLDLACGTGDVCRSLATRYPDARICGIDLSADMLMVARSACVDSPIEYREGDMSSLDSEDASVDVVTGSYALRNAPDLDVTLREIARVLKPGGVAGFLDFSKSPTPASQRIGYWVLKLWGSLWGLLVHANPTVYAYIAESLKNYPDREELMLMMARHGLSVESQRTFYFGLLQALVVKRVGVE